MDKPQLYVDMDGVLFDFDKSATKVFGMTPKEFEETFGPKLFWIRLKSAPNFYANLELMPDAMELWNGIKRANPTILTGLPLGEWAESQKRFSVKIHLGSSVPVIACPARDKSKYCKIPGSVLIDDRPKYKHLWEKAGGIFITHTNAKKSLHELKESGFWEHYV